MLRTRLIFNLLPFVVLLMAIGIYGIMLFSRITENVDVSVTGNYRSVRAIQQMKLALARMQGGVLMALEDGKGLGGPSSRGTARCSRKVSTCNSTTGSCRRRKN
jgi:hypothetical protein